MRGLLVVNGFLDSAKFADLYRLLLGAFHARGLDLQLCRTTDLVAPVGAPPWINRRNMASSTCAARPDFVLFWDKDAELARRFEAFGVKVYNSAATIQVCDDKLLTALALTQAALPTPATIIAPLTFEGLGYGEAIRDFLISAGEQLGFPLVIKEACGSFGEQVYLAATLDEALARIAGFGHKRFLLQEYIPTARGGGQDLRVNVVAGEAVASILRTNPHDFRSNVTHGGTADAYSPSPAVAALAAKAAASVGADFAGVDILLPDDRPPLICEVNSNPSFRSTLDATGVNLAEHIADTVGGGRLGEPARPEISASMRLCGKNQIGN